MYVKRRTLSHNKLNFFLIVNISMLGEIEKNSCEQGVDLVFKEMLNLLATYQIIYSNSEKFGRTMCKYLGEEVKKVFEAFSTHLKLFLEERTGTTREQSSVRTTAIIWKYCEELKRFSLEDCGFVLKEVKEQMELIADAIGDLKGQMNEEDDGFDEFGDEEECEVLSEQEKKLIEPLITLCQICKGFAGSFENFLFAPMQKICSSEESKRKKVVKWVEAFLDLVKKMSKIVDELVSLLEPPVDVDRMQKKCMVVHQTVLKGCQLLQLTVKKIFVEESDKQKSLRLIEVLKGMAIKQREQMAKALNQN